MSFTLKGLFKKKEGKSAFAPKRDFNITKERPPLNHFDVGVIGYWYATNYGSVLTYYSLYKAIENLGYKTVILDRPEKWNDGEPLDVFPRRFMDRFAYVSESYKNNEQELYNCLCDKFVVGSDQVWTKDAIRYTGYRFFLDFVSDDKVKVAYAPSFGQDHFNVTPEIKRTVSYFLGRFDGVSIRENTGVELCKKEFNVDAEQMIDPIFLNEKELYHEIAKHSDYECNKPYVLSYILDPDEDKRNMLLYTQKKKNMELINILDGRYNTFERNNQKLNLPGTLENVDAEQWVKLFANSEYVVTDSHHGFAMAVLFNKPVICIMNKERGGSRFTSLLGWLGMLDRLVDKKEDLDKKPHLFDSYDYTPVNKRIDKKREESLKWLDEKLKTRKDQPSTLYDYMSRKIKELDWKIWQARLENMELKKKLEELEKGE